jgi:hypothetical protein
VQMREGGEGRSRQNGVSLILLFFHACVPVNAEGASGFFQSFKFIFIFTDNWIQIMPQTWRQVLLREPKKHTYIIVFIMIGC